MFTQVGFSIDMTVTISPESGPVGTPITVEVKGIGWRQLFNSWVLLYDNNFTGWISAVTTGGSAKFTIPATGRPGVHLIEVLHGEFTFPYRNMQQNPEPDRLGGRLVTVYNVGCLRAHTNWRLTKWVLSLGHHRNTRGAVACLPRLLGGGHSVGQVA